MTKNQAQLKLDTALCMINKAELLLGEVADALHSCPQLEIFDDLAFLGARSWIGKLEETVKQM